MWYIDIKAYDLALNNLVEKNEITGDTAAKYLSCIRQIYNHMGERVDIKTLNSFFIDKLNDDRQFSQFLSAVRKYETCVLKQAGAILNGQPYMELVHHFKEISHKETAAGSGVTNETIFKKINAIRNEKLKLAFRLQYRSGLRVKEISELTKDDISFYNDGKIKIHVKCGKGGQARSVNVQADKYLYDHLKEFTVKSEGGKLFYSRSYLKQKAAEYGFESHDLRRINAKNRLQCEMSGGKKLREAKKVVQKEFGHKTIATTEIYLKE